MFYYLFTSKRIPIGGLQRVIRVLYCNNINRQKYWFYISNCKIFPKDKPRYSFYLVWRKLFWYSRVPVIIRFNHEVLMKSSFWGRKKKGILHMNAIYIVMASDQAFSQTTLAPSGKSGFIPMKELQ